MELDEIKGKVWAVVSEELKVDSEKLKEEDDLESLGADSMNVVNMVMELEEAFNFDMPESDLEKVKAVSHLVDYCNQKANS